MQLSKSQSKVKWKIRAHQKIIFTISILGLLLAFVAFFVFLIVGQSLIERCFYLFVYLSIYLAIVFSFFSVSFFFSGAMVSRFNFLLLFLNIENVLILAIYHPISKAHSQNKLLKRFRPKTDTAVSLLYLILHRTVPAMFVLNPLSPNIHIQILQTDLYTFPSRIS